MNPIRRAALPLLSVFMAVPACTTTGTPPPTNPGTPFVNCSDQAAVQAAQQILPQVVQALATGNYVGALATLATQYGQAEVVCAVQLAVNEIQTRLDHTPTASAPDPLVVTEHSNGKNWLASPAGQLPAAK